METSILSQISPIMSILSFATNDLEAFIATITDFINLGEKYKKSQIENRLLKDNILMLQQLYYENEALRTLNHLTLPKVRKITTTRIVSHFENEFINTATILAGKGQFIESGQVVVNGDGVVGLVTVVGEKISRVLLVTDTCSKIPVFFPRTKERAIVIGNTINLLVRYLAQGSKIMVGDLVVTSGDGALFPYGLPVGVVNEIKEEDITIEPFYDQNKLDLVTVLSY